MLDISHTGPSELLQPHTLITSSKAEFKNLNEFLLCSELGMRAETLLTEVPANLLPLLLTKPQRVTGVESRSRPSPNCWPFPPLTTVAGSWQFLTATENHAAAGQTFLWIGIFIVSFLFYIKSKKYLIMFNTKNRKKLHFFNKISIPCCSF